MRKKYWKIWALIAIYLFVSWFFPYSWISLHKSYSYKADEYFVKDYKNQIEDFKKTYRKNPKDGYTTEVTSYAVDLFTEKWLVSSNSVNISYNDLSALKHDIRNVRHAFIQLDRRGPEYTQRAQDMLYTFIDLLEYIELQIQELQDMRNVLYRPGAGNLLNNLHVDIDSSAETLIQFYEAHQNGY